VAHTWAQWGITGSAVAVHGETTLYPKRTLYQQAGKHSTPRTSQDDLAPSTGLQSAAHVENAEAHTWVLVTWGLRAVRWLSTTRLIDTRSGKQRCLNTTAANPHHFPRTIAHDLHSTMQSASLLRRQSCVLVKKNTAR